ncbi:MFS domain-containing histidine kinase [Microbacterium sp. YJN-G]|uniref:MFS domain-containing histidine kinase n=1 Tax=Microbacterium sp. YJN-G TaxID=2763257 RepID=UPI0018789F3A|nr:MFS domain-containing histidine kinase [Microbacterium sp. YJN-G]
MLTGFTVPPSSAAQYFGDSRCRSIWQWQLVIAFAVVTISVGVALLTPERFLDPLFSIGLVLIILTTVISLAIPWHRIGSAGVVTLPVLNVLFIGVVAAGGAPVATVLWVFPVVWTGTYFSMGVLIGVLSLIAVIDIAGLLAGGLTPETTIYGVTLMITLGFAGLVSSVGSRRNRSIRGLLRAQSDRLVHALQRVNDQKARTSRLMNSLDIGVARVLNGGLIDEPNDTFRTIYALGGAAQQHPVRPVEYRARRGEPIPSDQTSIARASRGEQFSDEIVWLFGLDGEWRAVKVSTKMIDHGVVTGDGLLLVVEDVTQTADPSASENAKRRTISHELRNPLTAILGHIDLLLEREDLPESARDQLTVVERAGGRMQRLIDDALLTPAQRRDEAGIDFDLADLARASLEGFAPAAESAGIAVDADLDERLPVSGDAFRMRQVVDNVVGNGIKYAQRGGRISVRGFRPAPGEVALVIADTGIGISEQDLPRIFEREFRTELARERGIPGTGLGLSISREIVVAADGRFEVRSELGQGTEVTVVLPAGPETTQDHDSTPNAQGKTA